MTCSLAEGCRRNGRCPLLKLPNTTSVQSTGWCIFRRPISRLEYYGFIFQRSLGFILELRIDCATI